MQHVEHVVFEHLDDVGQFVGGAVVDATLYEVIVFIFEIHSGAGGLEFVFVKSARGDGQQLDVGAGERGACVSEYLAEHLCALGGLLNSEVELCRSVGFPNVRTDEPDVRVAGEFEDEFFSLLETRCRFHDQSVGEASPLGVD